MSPFSCFSCVRSVGVKLRATESSFVTSSNTCGSVEKWEWDEVKNCRRLAGKTEELARQPVDEFASRRDAGRGRYLSSGKRDITKLIGQTFSRKSLTRCSQGYRSNECPPSHVCSQKDRNKIVSSWIIGWATPPPQCWFSPPPSPPPPPPHRSLVLARGCRDVERGRTSTWIWRSTCP